MEINLKNINEVVGAIRNYDENIGESLKKLYAAVMNCKVEDSDSLLFGLKQTVEMAILHAFRSFKYNERMLAEDKAAELFDIYLSVVHREIGYEEYGKYRYAADKVDDLQTEVDEIDEYITAYMFPEYSH